MKNYIVFDLEWNQSPDGKEGAVEKLPFEIIEIGAVKLDSQFHFVSEFRQLVKPAVYQQIHFKIMEVTHMNIEELEHQGKEFTKAAEDFFRWCGADYIFCTWGSMDLSELQRNIAYFQMEIPFPYPLLYYDVQKLYSILYGDGKLKLSLDVAVEAMQLKESRPFHRAADDAYYTGKIMKQLNFDLVKDYYSVDYYRIPFDKSEEIYITFPTYSKFVSKGYASKEDAVADKAVTDMVCYQCGRMLRKKIRWFSSNQKFYFCLACCPEHGFVKGKIRIKKSENGLVFVVKTIKLIDQDNVTQLYQKKEDTKRRRNEKNKQKRKNKKL